ncbi:hypothetical protein SARC_04426 [Sphaeroforma arctica JP610]|uniref:SGF29 C-terminal domain-containing protein n=1 Tax=Sphaeroforma arctica JP610 TaxID=667725 RepID=A0A0L0G3B6_9EUKA|nr:hypothetical protein SARC_04426 [Sphaeroforma arctica JP610]KNC83331.1 hypothetical protein SARC_04426 [Sphaeroforma arctica JP610]|eukprot:XP_014157233.1 hypothetical protein SARC_04426 [Sphaeroforma arctica JP610]
MSNDQAYICLQAVSIAEEATLKCRNAINVLHASLRCSATTVSTEPPAERTGERIDASDQLHKQSPSKILRDKETHKSDSDIVTQQKVSTDGIERYESVPESSAKSSLDKNGQAVAIDESAAKYAWDVDLGNQCREACPQLRRVYTNALDANTAELQSLVALSHKLSEIRKVRQFASPPKFLERVNAEKQKPAQSDSDTLGDDDKGGVSKTHKRAHSLNDYETAESSGKRRDVEKKGVSRAHSEVAMLKDALTPASTSSYTRGGGANTSANDRIASSARAQEHKHTIKHDANAAPQVTRQRTVGKSEIINSLDARIPVWKPSRTSDTPPPLCGATPVDTQYVVPSGHHVAAKISKPRELEEVWILATVVGFISDKNKYIVRDIMDEGGGDAHTRAGGGLGADANGNGSKHGGKHDIRSSKNGADGDTGAAVGKLGTQHYLSRKYVKPLPRSVPPTNYKPAPYYKEGTEVLAMYPQTTCFYPGKVLHAPHSQHGFMSRNDYIIEFSDDEDMDGTVPARPIAQKHVISRPKK